MSLPEKSPLLDFAAPVSQRKTRTVDPDGYKIVSVRLRLAEYEAFFEQVEALGMTTNQALRVATRRISGFLEIDQDSRRLLEQVVSEIGILSRTIAALQMSYATSKDVDMPAFIAARTAFGQDFAMLDNKLSEILNVSSRRVDGRHLLTDALDA